MRTYKPGQVPDDPANVPGFLRRETAALQRAAQSADPFSELQKLHAQPEKLREGMVALADGTDWNPGAGAGVYAYYNGAWVLLSASSLQLSVAASELQRLVSIGQEQLRQLTKIALLLSAIGNVSFNDEEIDVSGTQLTQLTKIAAILAVISGVAIRDDELDIPTF